MSTVHYRWVHFIKRQNGVIVQLNWTMIKTITDYYGLVLSPCTLYMAFVCSRVLLTFQNAQGVQLSSVL